MNKPSSILFDKNIPSVVIRHFNDLKWKTSIWGGDGLFQKTGPAFRLAKVSGVNPYNVFWGRLSHVIPNNDITLFMSCDDKHSNIDGWVKWVENDEIHLAAGDPVIQERWVTHPSETASKESCPICITLENMGWVDQGTTVDYMWNGNIKPIPGLPEYRMAHSTIGAGLWKVGDDKCKCSKQFRMGIQQSVQLRVVIPDHNQCPNHSKESL